MSETAVKKAIKAVAAGIKKAKRKPRSKGGNAGASPGLAVVAAPAAETIRLKRSMRATPITGGERVVLCDVISSVTVPASSGVGVARDFSINIPLVFSPNSSGRQNAGMILPDIAGKSLMYSRFKINACTLYWKPMCPTDTTGIVAAALIPNEDVATASVDELSAYSHSFDGAIWTPYATDTWRAEEKKYYDNSVNSSDLEPPQLTVVAVLSTFTTSIAQRFGQFWVHLDVDFVDPRPVPSTNITLAAQDLAQALVYGGALADRAIAYTKMVSGMGIWNWFRYGVARWLSYSGTPYEFPTNTMLDMDAGKFMLQTNLNLSAEVASVEEKGVMPLLAWDSRSDEDSVSVSRVRRLPWRSEPARITVIADFKNYDEAVRAKRDGYDPALVLSSMPNAAGDFTLSLLCQPRYSTDEAALLKVITVSPGTGAYSLDYSWYVDADTGPCSYAQTVQIATSSMKRTVTSSLLTVSQLSSTVTAPHS